MNEPKYYTTFEGDKWAPWERGEVDGRALKKRGKTAVEIAGVQVHSLSMKDGREWDCINGWRDEAAKVALIQADMRAGVELSCLGSTNINPAQEYARRVWSGQSISLSRHERMGRIRAALEAQGLSMEGVVLP